MNYPLIDPNFHVLLIHFPIGLVLMGLLIELFAPFYRTSQILIASRWMILIGSLLAVPVSLTGMDALAGLVRASNESPGSWRESIAASSMSPEAVTNLVRHGLFQGGATLVCLLTSILWLACSDQGRQRRGLFLLPWLLAGGLMVVGSYFGGAAVHRQLVSRYHPAPAEVPIAISGTEQINLLLPPAQNHVFVAGIAIALGAVAVGLSMRRSNEAQGSGAVTPAARFWLMALVGAAIAAGLGLCMLAGDFGTWNPKELLALLQDRALPRRFTHACAGTVLVGVPLLLAMISRWIPSQRWLVGILGLLWMAAALVQMGSGMLMLLDSPSGPLWEFNP